MKEVEEKGRKGDNLIAHLTEGEIVIPKTLAKDKEFRQVVGKYLEENGASLEQYTVGSGENNINPETGYMEFGFSLKDIAKPFKKIIEKVKDIFSPDMPEIPKPTPEPRVIAPQPVESSSSRMAGISASQSRKDRLRAGLASTIKTSPTGLMYSSMGGKTKLGA